MKRFGLGLLAALILVSISGCEKSNSDAPQPKSTLNPQPSTLNPQIARVHWLGKDRIAAETNAARFLSLWNLPESAALEIQTLDKLAVLLAGEPPLVITNPVWLPGEPPPTNKPSLVSRLAAPGGLAAPKPGDGGPTLNYPLSTRLRPLLDDLVRQECYLEIQTGRDASRTLSPSEGERAGERGPSSRSAAGQNPSNGPLSPPRGERGPLGLNLRGMELALAVRLDAPRAGLWTSNLAALFGSLTNAQSLPAPTNAHAWRVSSLSPSEGERARVRGLSSRSAARQPPSNSLLSPSLSPSEGERARERGPSSRSTARQSPSNGLLSPSLSPSEGERGTLRLDLVRVGEWTLVGLAREHNALLDDFAARLARTQTPLSTNPPIQQSTNPPLWLEADLDLPRLLAWARGGDGSSPNSSNRSARRGDEPSPPLATNLPRILLTAQADDAGVRTRAKLDFPEPLPLEMEPWNIPTNLIHDPLVGFTAIRGLRWLTNFTSAFPGTSSFILHPSSFPNQAFFWAQAMLPSLHFLAFPSADASNQVYQLSELVLRDVNPILATNGWPLSAFARQTNSPGIKWLGHPDFSPSLDYADCGSNRFLIAGLAHNTMTNEPAPAALFQYLQASPKLVAYDWENTRTCVDGWIQMGQLTRHMLCLPRLSFTAGMNWVSALSLHLTNSITSVELSSPTRLAFARSSSVGFTGVELHLLADWLESPTFPRGLHTFTAPLPPPPPPPEVPPPPQTNRPAAPK